MEGDDGGDRKTMSKKAVVSLLQKYEDLARITGRLYI